MTTDVFEGRPIEGEVQHYSTGPATQHEPQVFLDALDALLAVPGVDEVRWHQYTPYFNDGEPCTFRIYGAQVKVAGDDDDEAGDYGDGYRDSYDFYDYSKPDRGLIEIEGVDIAAVQNALRDFEGVLGNGHHYVVLNQKFGDPAQVTATQAGFSVEFYEHE